MCAVCEAKNPVVKQYIRIEQVHDESTQRMIMGSFVRASLRATGTQDTGECPIMVCGLSTVDYRNCLNANLLHCILAYFW